MPNGVKHHYKRTTCRLCTQGDLKLRVPIPATPLGGAFVTKAELSKEQDVYPLDLYQCASCGHVQILDVVDPQVIYSNYTYFSGRTSLVEHFRGLAEAIVEGMKSRKQAFVVDVGSNDGAFLGFFQRHGMRVLGVDPAQNIARYANERGVETLPEMFVGEVARRIRRDYGPANVVTALNVFAHTDDLNDMAGSVKHLLADDGLFVFEVSYLVDVVDKMLLGTIFHEHLSYHTVRPLVGFLERQGLELIHARRVSVQGGSLVCTAQVAGGKREVAASVGELINLEEEKGVYASAYLGEFASRLEAITAEATELIRDLPPRKKSIAAFGAARGGTLITYLFGLGDVVKFIVDDDPSKHALYSPGYHIPVLPTEVMYEEMPDYVVILAWVHSKKIVESHKTYLDNGGQFITVFPELRVIGKDTVHRVGR